MQARLDVIIDSDVRIVHQLRLAELLCLLDAVVVVLRPLAEVGCLIGVAQVAENGIRS